MLSVTLVYSLLQALKLTVSLVDFIMPGHPQLSTFEYITVTELHPTFGAEISGVDFSRPIEGKVFPEILSAMSRVSSMQRQDQN